MARGHLPETRSCQPGAGEIGNWAEIEEIDSFCEAIRKVSRNRCNQRRGDREGEERRHRVNAEQL